VADVARLANVSSATVSYVLNNVEGQKISAQTQAAVLRAAEMLRYRPNLAARNLAVGTSGVVLYVMPRTTALGELPMRIGSRLTTALASHGVVLSPQFETDDKRIVVDAIDNLQPVAVTGLLPLADTAAAAAAAAGIPQIHLGSDVNAVASLNAVVEELRVNHLVSRGHRRLGFAYTESASLRPLGDYWLAALRAAARTRGLPDIDVATVASDGSNAAAVVRRWVGSDVTAVCAQNNDTAFALLHGVLEAGLHCPADLAVVGVDAAGSTPPSVPPLTTVEFDADTIAEIAVATIVEALGYPAPERPGDTDIARLVERHST
jgi:DNA-binding LacI/PurR family transcriptional regulator